MNEIRHVMILASAGSGKTHALTNRFVSLLARGAAPERIVALTFTRKAAGEFFDEILAKLAKAARDAAAAGKLAREVGKPELTSADFLAMLRQVIDSMHRLRLGTMDGFFAGIVRAFPFELGLSGDFEILQEHAARRERRRVLQRMFVRPAGGLADAQRNFIEEFKRATFGAEEKRLGARLDSFLDKHQQLYLDAPDAELWGNERRIWPAGCRWLGVPVEKPRAVQALRRWLGESGQADKQRARWEDFLSEVETWAPGASPVRAIEYVLEKALGDWDALVAGRAVLEFDRREQRLGGEACAALADLVIHMVGGEFRRRLETTRGIHAVVSAYDAAYHVAVRLQGKLTFADVQRLLLPALQSGARALGDRLALEFRLDGGVEHWLLDEFQDTSFGQWSILGNLIDEAIQDPEGRRSFFCVGDVKQSIFTWREGDPSLFGEIFRHYTAAAPGTIVEERLFRSWRSGPAVVEAVNRVFGNHGVFRDLFPSSAAQSWIAAWKDHESAVAHYGGQAALLYGDDEEARWSVCLKLLTEISPIGRGLTCAILVQKNDAAARLADYLRREGGLPAVAESDLHVCQDNPLGAALLALFHAASHPGDRLAWQHVLMTPLAGILNERGLAHPSLLSDRLLRQVHSFGFAKTVEDWLRSIEPFLAAGDVFSRARAAQFAAAAGAFDRTGSREISDFVDFMERYTSRDAESPSVIRVMTIHKSKGLGFDVVLLPDLEGQSLSRMRDGLAVKKAADRSTEWILELPPKLFRDGDPVLEAYVGAREAEACYEKFSLLYVAMTRAKRGMYAIIAPPADSKSANFPRLLDATLGRGRESIRVGAISVEGSWASGDSGWHLGFAARAHAPAEAAPNGGVDLARASRAPRRPARRPSAESGRSTSAASLFEPDGASEYGSAVHRLLAEVDWADSAAGSERVRAWSAADPVEAEAKACVESPVFAEIWNRFAASAKACGMRCEVWRERAFETLWDGAWVSGVLDRVVLARDGAGAPVSATIYDFKTGAVPRDADLGAEATRYSSQMGMYRGAVALLAGLPVAAVASEIVFTRAGRKVAIASPPAGAPR